MIKLLKSKSRIKLSNLIKIYLTKTDTTKESFEMDNHNEKNPSDSITFWHYPAQKASGYCYEINYIQFIFQFLLKEMYKGELFKFNKIMSQSILKADETTDIVDLLWKSHLEMQASKKNTAKEIRARKNKKSSTTTDV